jgi:tetratricopeptide (TPR) repeat protein
MKFRATSLTVLTLTVGIVGTARPAPAQESAVLNTIRDLATAPDLPVAQNRLRTALAEWDREIARLQAQLEPKALGLMLQRRGRLPEALRQFDAAGALEPGAADVQLLRALTLDAAGRPDEAGRAYQAAWVRDAASPIKAYLVLRRTRGIDAASRERARGVLREAYERILSGKYRAPTVPFLIIDLVPDASTRTPIAGDARLARVFARLAGGRLDEAVAALANGGAAPSPDDSALARIARGQAAEREGRLSDARREYGAALEGTLSGRYLLHVGIARLAQVEGDTDAAVDAFEHAVRLAPNDPALRREFAAALVAAARVDDAFAELVAALLIAPNDADVLAAVGQLFLDTDRAGDAIAPLRRALALKADRYQTHYALAVALARAGKAEDAAREFEQFDRLNRQMLDGRRRAVAGQGPDGAQR